MGLNAAKLYGIDVDKQKKKLENETIAVAAE
jgi:hypothetical protein